MGTQPTIVVPPGIAQPGGSFPSPYASGRAYSGLPLVAPGSGALADGYLSGVPVYLPDTPVLKGLGAYRISVTVGGFFRVGIYKIENGLPTTLVVDGPPLDAGVNSDQTVPITWGQPAGWYLPVVVPQQSGAASVPPLSVVQNSIIPLVGRPSVFGIIPGSGYAGFVSSATAPGANPLSGPLPPVFTNPTNTNQAAIPLLVF